MLTITVGAQLSSLDALLAFRANISAVQRELASAILAEIISRIHVDGKKADGSQIGTYSIEYMKVRTGQFAIRGKEKAGVFTKGKNKGQQRPSYNRGSDTKVILSLTRQLEKSYRIVQVNDKSYAIAAPDFEEIIEGLEIQYGGGIYKLSAQETANVNAFIDEELTKYINAAK